MNWLELAVNRGIIAPIGNLAALCLDLQNVRRQIQKGAWEAENQPEPSQAGGRGFESRFPLHSSPDSVGCSRAVANLRDEA